MQEAIPRSGGCHCGRVRFTVTTDLTEVVSCNCSICTKLGALWTFVDADKVSFEGGRDDLPDYQFNKRVIRHRFCPNCGIEAFADGEMSGKKIVAVNVRCLDDVDLSALNPAPFDGKNM